MTLEYKNKHKFSKIVRMWLEANDYDHHPGTRSASALIAPVRKTILYERHPDELDVDYEDLIAPRYGDALHASLEKVFKGKKGFDTERRMFGNVHIDGPAYIISGKFDLLVKQPQNKLHLWDGKSTSAWGIIYGSHKADWSKQISIYRWLIYNDPHYENWSVDDVANIFAWCTDWQRSRAKQSKDYPATRVVEMTVDLMPYEETEAFIKERLRGLLQAEKLQDQNLPYCTNEELWKDPDEYAVMKEGRKSAVRAHFKSEEECNEFIATVTKDQDKHYIEARPSKARRCGYCGARPVCHQYRELKAQDLIEED